MVRAIYILLFSFSVLLYGWAIYLGFSDTLSGLAIGNEWRPLARNYTARVVALADRGGVRVRSTSLVVEIRFADGSTKRFTSSRSGSLHLLGIGDRVRVLTSTAEVAGFPIESFEIDSAFELWVKDILFVLGVVTLPLALVAWIYRPLRFRR